MTQPVRIDVLAWPARDLAACLATQDAVIVAASLHASETALERALDLLPAVERIRYETYTNVVVGRRFAMARATVREVVGSILGMSPASVPLYTGAHGKPILGRGLAHPPLWFSVAHCDDLALVAASRTADVGVDLERVRSIEHWERVAARVLDRAERAQLRRAVEQGEDAGSAFLRHWCRVEAELKAIGCGIAGLETHLAGKRPRGLRVVDLDRLPVPGGEGSARYQGAVALCTPSDGSEPVPLAASSGSGDRASSPERPNTRASSGSTRTDIPWR